MLRGEGWVKGLHAQAARVLFEMAGAHESNRAESSDVPIVNRSPVGEHELDGGVRPFSCGERTRIDQQRASKSGLDDESVARREIEYDQFRPTPAPGDRRRGDPTRQLAWRDLAENVGLRDTHIDDCGAA